MMHVKKVTQKDRYGNTLSYEFEAPEKPLDPTRLMEKQMELQQPDMIMESMSVIPPVGGEEFQMGDPTTHPGEPRGQDTVPAWLTPGEFVVNAEATQMFGPEIEAMNEVGRMAQGGQVPQGYHRMPDGSIMADSAMNYNIGGPIDYAELTSNKATPGMQRGGQVKTPFIAAPLMFPPQYRESGGDIPMPISYQQALLESREGFVPEIYLDSLGKPTVGHGHLIEDAVWEKSDPRIGTQPYSKEELDSFFSKDMDTAESAARRNVGDELFDSLDRRQRAALTSMAFQLGEKGQSKFKKMIKALKKGDHREVAKQALTGSEGGKSKWLKQTPVRALDLAEAFDPDMAAQYRQAGGRVYDDMPAQYAFLGKLIESLTPAQAGEINMDSMSPEQQAIYQGLETGETQAYADTLSSLINQGVPPEEAVKMAEGMNPVPAEPDYNVIDYLNTPLSPSDLASGVGDMVLGDKGREALGMPERTEADSMGWTSDWWKGERLKEQEAAAAQAEVEANIAANDAQIAAREEGAAMMRDAESLAQQGRDVEAAQKRQEATQMMNDAEAAFKQQQEDSAEIETSAKKNREKQDILQDIRRAEREQQYATGETANEASVRVMEDIKTSMDTAPGSEGDNPAANTSSNEIIAAGEGATEEEKLNMTEQVRGYLADALGEEVGGALGSFFNVAELTKMGVYALGSMAFGASPMQALNFGVKQYIGGLEREQQATAAQAKLNDQRLWSAATSGKYTPESVAQFKKTGDFGNLVPVDPGSDKYLPLMGKFTTESIEAYRQSGQLADLQPVPQGGLKSNDVVQLKKDGFTDASISQYIETGNPMVLQKTAKPAKAPKRTTESLWVQGQGVLPIWQDPESGKQFVRQKDGGWAGVEELTNAGMVGNYDKSTMGDAAVEQRASTYISELEGVVNQGQEKGSETFINTPNTELASRYNRVFQDELRNTKYPIGSQSALKNQLDQATRMWMEDYAAAKREGRPAPNPVALDHYYNALKVTRNNGISPRDMIGTSPHNSAIIDEMIAKEGGETQAVYATAYGAWASVPDGEKEKFAKDAKKLGGYSGFTYFMRELLEDKDRATKYLP